MFSSIFSGRSASSLKILIFSPVNKPWVPIVRILVVGPEVTAYFLTATLVPEAIVETPRSLSVILTDAVTVVTLAGSSPKGIDKTSFVFAPIRYPPVNDWGISSESVKPDK